MESLIYNIQDNYLTINIKKSLKLNYNIYKNKELIFNNVKTIEKIKVEVNDLIECYFLKYDLELPFCKILVEEGSKSLENNQIFEDLLFFNYIVKSLDKGENKDA